MDEQSNEHSPDPVVEFAHRLFDGARAGDTGFVVGAVEQGAPVDLADASGNTLLMLAAYHGNAELVAALARLGADVNRSNDRGQTPLAGAVFKRHAPVMLALLRAGADPDAGAPSARAAAQMFGVELPRAE
ncbi:ankyrin repeat domain-containing protein [Leucobacter sp. CSA1]|uniref:Ankyrin repeat domain-containing protein n=1 Tax=Leucobacter chromiisoli TaxID=2796471 RepID=A0A934UT66_9MICO|nr:ankyrin repeat domain-containing protein [Leucobacter chromiisoli]MBK0418054.1 ankyrin repeat domain-containing protein [Leucobacter chromiisoli]